MSFILEALKKADAERDRGAVPDLHAQGMLPEAAFEAEPAGRARPWLWLVAGAVLALVAGAGWRWLESDVAPPAGPVAVAPAPAAAPPIATPPTAPVAVAPAAPASVATPMATAPSATRGDSARPAQEGTREPAPARREARVPLPTPAETAGKADASRRPVATAPAAPRNEAAQPPGEQPAAAATTSAARQGATATPSPPSKGSSTPRTTPAEHVPLLAELPDDVRRQVPALKLGGLVYSAAPASRMVLVNGDLQREGSAIAPGLTLERINPKSIVFALRGQRFEVPMN